MFVSHNSPEFPYQWRIQGLRIPTGSAPTAGGSGWMGGGGGPGLDYPIIYKILAQNCLEMKEFGPKV